MTNLFAMKRGKRPLPQDPDAPRPALVAVRLSDLSAEKAAERPGPGPGDRSRAGGRQADREPAFTQDFAGDSSLAGDLDRRKKPTRRKPEGSDTKRGDADDGGRSGGGRKVARPMTPKRIRNIAEHYVASRECSAAMLRAVLERRASSWLRTLAEGEREDALAETRAAIEAEVERMQRLGYIDDARFARLKARSGLAAGKGAWRVARDLGAKGVDGDLLRDALVAGAREFVEEGRGWLAMPSVDDEHGDDEETIIARAEREAAETHARKRGLGRFRRRPLPEDRLERMKIWRREAASLARAGFGMDLIREVLDEGFGEELDESSP